jgi:cytochrome c556
MNKKLYAAGLIVALGAGFALPAAAQVKPEVLVKQRQAKMTLQGKYVGPLAAMAQGKAPYDAAVVARNAGFLEALSMMAWDGFDASTQGVKSEALPAIWQEPGKFKEAQERNQRAAADLVAATKGGDEAGVKAAIGAFGKTCGGCHQDFREKQK